MASCDVERMLNKKVDDEGLSHLLFVYGTLKRGFTNHCRYLGEAEAHGKAHFLSCAMTVDSFPLVVRPASTRAPVLMDRAGSGHRIHGEVFMVDDSTLEAMDLLEGVRTGHYYKQLVKVSLSNDQREVACYAYFFPACEVLLQQEHLHSYLEEHHALYQPRDIKEEITRLCRRPDHKLRTTVAVPMKVHCLRLLPGEDLLCALRSFAACRQIMAAAIISCVGSTGKTTLRPAGVPTPKVFEGKFEIVSLTGTLSACGHHLHMSISDASCNVYGGHVLEGCIVRTTAEIVLGLLDGLRFTRPFDARTGWDELSISPVTAALDIVAKRRRLGDDPVKAAD